MTNTLSETTLHLQLSKSLSIDSTVTLTDGIRLYSYHTLPYDTISFIMNLDNELED